MAGCYEYFNGLWNSIKDGEFLEQLTDYKFSNTLLHGINTF
jgi:hypothetical protein